MSDESSMNELFISDLRVTEHACPNKLKSENLILYISHIFT